MGRADDIVFGIGKKNGRAIRAEHTKGYTWLISDHGVCFGCGINLILDRNNDVGMMLENGVDRIRFQNVINTFAIFSDGFFAIL